jgi:aspartyl-tRNA(Asn)/glutamyl-tRNA(Gln) amidotransferase subunit C
LLKGSKCGVAQRQTFINPAFSPIHALWLTTFFNTLKNSCMIPYWPYLNKVFTMSLTNADVRKVARLARLAMSETEIESARTQLTGIFDLIAEMQAVDTTGIAPMSHAQDLSQRLREDVVTEADQRELFQSIAPQVEAGLYLVPQVIE